MSVEQVYDEVSKCSRCGFCQPTCPTYAVSGLEREVARGRNSIVRGVIEKRLDFTKDLKKSLFQCLLCDACVTNCFPAVKTDEVMAAARHEYISRYGQPQLQRFIFKNLLRNPNALARYVKLASFGKRSGISGLVQVLRILGWFGKNIANAEGLLERIPKTFLRERLNATIASPVSKRGTVAYFVGCGINFAFPHVGEATINIFQTMGYDVDLLPNYCCGLPAYAYGDLDSVSWFVERNLQVLTNTTAEVIVTDCGSCTSFLHEYPRLVNNNPKLADKAESVKTKIQDMTKWMSLHFAEPATTSFSDNLRVTYHDPCHLAHHMKDCASARQILNGLPNLQFVELPESNWCCGGAGSYNIAHYDLSMKILKRKMENVRKTNAQILATACPACLIQLSYGARLFDVPVQVKHISELAAMKSNQ